MLKSVGVGPYDKISELGFDWGPFNSTSILTDAGDEQIASSCQPHRAAYHTAARTGLNFPNEAAVAMSSQWCNDWLYR
jgi:hypothetical protein